MIGIVKAKREPGIELREVPVPEIREAGILVRVRAASLCGSDVHIFEWTPNYEFLPMPIVLGHEFAGEVVAVGAGVTTVAVGERITARPTMPCGVCPTCRVGLGERCRTKPTLGMSVDGAFAPYVRLTAAAGIYPLPTNVSYRDAALCEPLSVALNAVETAGLKAGEKAAILGPGPIGLLTLQVLRATGAGFVMMAGTMADGRRLAVAETLGADAIVDVHKEDLVKRALALPRSEGGRGFDVVFEATGDPRSVAQALGMVRHGGKVVLVGIHSGPAQFDPTELVRHRKSIVGAYAWEPDTWYRSLALLSSGKVQVAPLVSHELPLAAAAHGFELAVRKEAVKVIFTPEE